MITLVKVEVLVKQLEDAGYPSTETEFLRQGFTQVFNIGYGGPQQRCSRSENIPFTIGNSVILWNKLMKEVKFGRVAGPFEQIPFEHFIQSPIGLIPKAGSDEARLIFHLSYDFKNGLKSLTSFTPKEK